METEDSNRQLFTLMQSIERATLKRSWHGLNGEKLRLEIKRVIKKISLYYVYMHFSISRITPLSNYLCNLSTRNFKRLAFYPIADIYYSS